MRSVCETANCRNCRLHLQTVTMTVTMNDGVNDGDSGSSSNSNMLYSGDFINCYSKVRFPFKRNRLRFLLFSFTQRTQRTQSKRLRLNGNRA